MENKCKCGDGYSKHKNYAGAPFPDACTIIGCECSSYETAREQQPDNLKPCPFDGGEAVFEESDGNDHYVICTLCSAHRGFGLYTPSEMESFGIEGLRQKSAEAWNTRPVALPDSAPKEPHHHFNQCVRPDLCHLHGPQLVRESPALPDSDMVEARSAAWQEYLEAERSVGIEAVDDLSVRSAFMNGYDKGRPLSSGSWVAVRSEADLPKELAEYWWTRRTCPVVDRMAFNPMSPEDCECSLRDYSAYMRAEQEPEPYKENV